jgi:hypothetical protein
MSVIKTIKFDLPIDGVKVKNLEELREHFTVEILDLYYAGILIKWLQSRSLTEELAAVKRLAGYSDVRFTMMQKLCEIFKVEADNLVISLAIGEPIEKVTENFSEISLRYKNNERNKINKELEEQYYDLVNKVDYAIYYSLRLTMLSNHYSSSGFDVYAKQNEFLKKKDGRIADTEYAFVDGIFKDRIWQQNTHELRQYEAFGWFLCSEFAGNYDYDYYNNAYLFKSIQQQRKDCLYALTQSVDIPYLKKIFLQRCDELEKIIAILPDKREKIMGHARMEALSEKEKKLICYGRLETVWADLNMTIDSNFKLNN